MTIVNISAYKFISLDALPELREHTLARCEALALKGTILLAPEGINLFLAGSREAIDSFMHGLHADARFADIQPKESLSETAPFGRMRVRLKKEIITMRMPAIQPEGERAPAVDAATLQRWLDRGHDDDGREVLLLDTRNNYEIDRGAFDGAVDYRLASFTGFPDAVAADRGRYDGKTVVSYCTGGIRCEKAALHMRELGMKHVYQLDGGILAYLEHTDGAHWHGDCFVFDGRGAVDQSLAPASIAGPIGTAAGASDDACADNRSRHVPLSRPREETTARMQEVEQCTERLQRAEVKGQAGGGADSKHASMDSHASTRPSPLSSPPRREEANARSELLYWGGA